MNTQVTYVIRLMGSFQTITIHGRSGSWTSSSAGLSTCAGAVPIFTELTSIAARRDGRV